MDHEKSDVLEVFISCVRRETRRRGDGEDWNAVRNVYDSARVGMTLARSSCVHHDPCFCIQ
jgi:hypothetical protein